MGRSFTTQVSSLLWVVLAFTVGTTQVSSLPWVIHYPGELTAVGRSFTVQVSSLLWVIAFTAGTIKRCAHCCGSFTTQVSSLLWVVHYPGELTAVGCSLPR